MSQSRRVIGSNRGGRNDAGIQHQMAEAMRYRAIGTGRPIVSRGRAAIVREVLDLLGYRRLMGVQYLAGHRLQGQPQDHQDKHDATEEGHDEGR